MTSLNSLPGAETEQGIDRDYMSHVVPGAQLKRMLDALGINVAQGEIDAAVEAQFSEDPVQPGQRTGLVFRQLGLQGIQVSQLHWVRFDQRKLPALVFHAKQWIFVTRGESGELILTDEQGQSSRIAEGELQDCMVLWVRSQSVQPDRENDEEPQENLALKLVLGEVFRDRRWVREVLIATLVINLLAISTSLFALQVYDRVVPTLAYATLYTLVGGMLIVISLDWVLKTLRARILDSVSTNVDRAVSQKVFDHVMQLQLDARPRSLGTLAAQVGGLDTVRQFFTSGVIFALVDMPFALLFIALIAYIGGPVALVYLILLPLAAILGYVTQLRMRRLIQQQMQRSHERQGVLVDAIQGTESIRSNNANWRFSELWGSITDSIGDYNVRQKAISNFATVTTGSLASIAYVSGIVVGVGQIEAGAMSMGGLIACTILGGRVIAPVSQSVQYLAQWQGVEQALSMVNAVLQLKTERRPEQQLIIPDESPSQVAVEGLAFSYPDSPVKQVSIKDFTVTAGERVAVIGPLGSGKSTLLKILAGLYRPSAGRVLLGTADLWEMDPGSVADQVGFLPQNVHLFKGSLRSNLIISGSVNDTMLLDVCRITGIDQIAADNPKGMDLDITEGGEGLSGGQRQLVGLGRVMLARPNVWLLDEPSSSLDNQSEQRILTAIKQYLRPQDILIVATHRPRVAKVLADRVIVMQRGEIKVDGPAEQVMADFQRRANEGVQS